MNFRKGIIVIITAVVFLAAPLGGTVWAEFGKQMTNNDTAEPAAMLVDVTATRPLGALSILLGSATFIVSLPFSLLGGNTPDAFESLIVSPFQYTFFRPLGRI